MSELTGSVGKTTGFWLASPLNLSYKPASRATEQPLSLSLGKPVIEVGSHFIVELYGCPERLIDDLDHVVRSVREAVVQSNSTLLQDVSHRFHPQGVTAIALLAESHISVHTWPEHGYVAADAFTCGDTASPEKACEYFVGAFQAERHLLRKIERGPVLDARPGAEAPASDKAGQPAHGAGRLTGGGVGLSGPAS